MAKRCAAACRSLYLISQCASSRRAVVQPEIGQRKKGGVDLSAFHATQGRRIVVRNLITIRPVSARVLEAGKFFRELSRAVFDRRGRRQPFITMSAAAVSYDLQSFRRIPHLPLLMSSAAGGPALTGKLPTNGVRQRPGRPCESTATRALVDLRPVRVTRRGSSQYSPRRCHRRRSGRHRGCRWSS
jgi:hypothetical protein